MSSSRAAPQAPVIPRGLEDCPTSADEPRTWDCDACGKTFEGVPGGAGLFVWTRGSEVRYEEPPLCDDCANEIAIGALMKWDVEEEDE